MAICCAWTNRKRHRPLALCAALFVLTLLLGGCHREKEVCQTCGDDIAPPVGLAFSIPSGDAAFFSLSAPHVIRTMPLTNVAVIAADINASGYVAVVEASADALRIYRLPRLEFLGGIHVGGTVEDVAMHPNNTTAFGLTRNGNLWRYTLGSDTPDTLGLRLFPHRITLRPPDDTQAWIACPASNVIQIADLFSPGIRDSVVIHVPSDVQFSANGHLAYIGSKGDSGTVFEYNTDDRRFSRSIRVGTGPFELAVSRDDRYVAAADSAGHAVHFWDLSNEQTWSVPLGGVGGRVHFAQGTPPVCFVLVRNLSMVKRVEISGAAPHVTDSLQLEFTVGDFVLWENAP